MTKLHPLENLYQEELYSIKPKVLVVISMSWSEIGEDERILLGKILNAVKLSISAVQVIARKDFTVEDFNSYRPAYIIAFGATFRDSNEMYKNVSYDDASVVVAHALHELDDSRKKQLWLTLKQVFHS